MPAATGSGTGHEVWQALQPASGARLIFLFPLYLSLSSGAQVEPQKEKDKEGRERVGLTRRPAELAAGEEVDVQMRDGFAAVGTVIDHDAEAGAEIQLFRQGLCRQQ